MNRIFADYFLNKMPISLILSLFICVNLDDLRHLRAKELVSGLIPGFGLLAYT